MTVPALAKSKFRCYRCGLHKTGEDHKAGSAKNSVEYYTVPVEKRLNGWIVPDGYEVGDTRKAAETRTVRRNWNRHKQQNGIIEHANFPDCLAFMVVIETTAHAVIESWSLILDSVTRAFDIT